MNICWFRHGVAKSITVKSLCLPTSSSGKLINVASVTCLVGPSGLEPPTSCLSGTRSNLLSYEPMWLVWILLHTQDLPFQEVSLLTFLFKESKWWRWWDSNPWPPACRAGALPAELHPHICYGILLSPFLEAFLLLVGPSGLEPPTSCLSGTRSNLLSYEPMWLVSDFCFTWLLFNFGGRFYSSLDWRCRHWAIFPYSLP